LQLPWLDKLNTRLLEPPLDISVDLVFHLETSF
jgi:hypothetical protein